MKKTELVLLVFTVSILLMKSFHVIVSENLIVLSLLSISIFYCYLGFALFNNIGFRDAFNRDLYRAFPSIRLVGAVITGVALCISLLGIVFKFLSWPGASVFLILGLFGLIVILIVSLIKIKKSSDDYYLNILKRVIVFAALCAFLLFVPSKIWLDWKHSNNPEYVNAILEAQKNPENRVLWNKVDEERRRMSKPRE